MFLFALFLLCTADLPTDVNLGFGVTNLKVGTWNTMSLPWMPYQDLVLKSLIERDFDVLHLQEVWTPETREKVLEATKHKYRYSYFSPSRTVQDVGCNPADPNWDLLPQFIGCALMVGVNTSTLAQAYPVPLPSDGELPCGVIGVGIALNGALDFGNPDPFASSHKGQQCLACLINTLQNLDSAFSSIEPAITTCATFQGRRYTVGGSNGQLILSKHPLGHVINEEFDSYLFARSNIYATIKGIKFAFSHWSFNIMADYYPAFEPFQYGTLGMDHAKAAIAEKADVILGDLNSGTNYQGAAYQYLVDNGYTDLVQPQPTETWCPPDHLEFLPCVNGGQYSAAIDHILVRNDWKLWGSRYTGTFNSKPLMSDHIGLTARISMLDLHSGVPPKAI